MELFVETAETATDWTDLKDDIAGVEEKLAFLISCFDIAIDLSFRFDKKLVEGIAVLEFEGQLFREFTNDSDIGGLFSRKQKFSRLLVANSELIGSSGCLATWTFYDGGNCLVSALSVD